jgi:prophage antirepressor-like protein
MNDFYTMMDKIDGKFIFECNGQALDTITTDDEVLFRGNQILQLLQHKRDVLKHFVDNYNKVLYKDIMDDFSIDNDKILHPNTLFVKLDGIKQLVTCSSAPFAEKFYSWIEDGVVEVALGRKSYDSDVEDLDEEEGEQEEGEQEQEQGEASEIAEDDECDTERDTECNGCMNICDKCYFVQENKEKEREHEIEIKKLDIRELELRNIAKQLDVELANISLKQKELDTQLGIVKLRGF